MSKTILALLLATTTLSFADIFEDACRDYDQQALSNKRLTVLDYAEELSVRTNQARTDRNEKAADRLLKLFAVTVSTGLKFGINKNPAPALVDRLLKAMDNAYSPLSKKGVSPQDLAESLVDMDEVFETSRNRGTLDQYAAVVEYSYQAVGLDKKKPWDSIPNINNLKKQKPSLIFKSLFEDKEGEASLSKKKTHAAPPQIYQHQDKDYNSIKGFQKYDFSHLTKEQKDLLEVIEKLKTSKSFNHEDSTKEQAKVKQEEKELNDLSIRLVQEKSKPNYVKWLKFQDLKKTYESSRKKVDFDKFVDEIDQELKTKKDRPNNPYYSYLPQMWMDELNRHLRIDYSSVTIFDLEKSYKQTQDSLLKLQQEIKEKDKHNETLDRLKQQGVNPTNLQKYWVEGYLEIAEQISTLNPQGTAIVELELESSGSGVDIKNVEIKYSDKLKLKEHHPKDVYFWYFGMQQRMNGEGKLASYNSSSNRSAYETKMDSLRKILGR